MGGKDKQKEANRQQQAINTGNQRKIDAQNLINEGKSRGLEYTSGLTEAQRGARLKAEGEVTSRRAKGIKDSNDTLTKYNSQERRRLFEAKKGQGQVGAEDTAITSDMMQGAKDLLGRGSDYWDATRTAAGDKAFSAANDAYVNKMGSEQDFINKGKLKSNSVRIQKQMAEDDKYKTYKNKGKPSSGGMGNTGKSIMNGKNQDTRQSYKNPMRSLFGRGR